MGDLPGHPSRGDQWTAGQAVSDRSRSGEAKVGHVVGHDTSTDEVTVQTYASRGVNVSRGDYRARRAADAARFAQLPPMRHASAATRNKKGW